MSTIETIGVFVGIPVGVALVVAGLIYARGSRRDKRYRPGRAFEFAPVWFLASPKDMVTDTGTGVRVVTGANRLALGKGAVEGAPERWSGVGLGPQEAMGGASDRW